MKRLVAGLLILVFIISLSIGIAVSQKSAYATSKITLKLGAWASSPAEKKIVQNQIAAFKKLYPNVDIKLVEIVGDYNQKMQLLTASKTEPDIFYMDSMPAWQYIAKGVLEPLDYWMKNTM
ncbi:extracellular solute-binding protein [Caldicellulosiruptor naganoensis]|uniref:Extracellular solute-binding protein n=1 Tax=Caldicellulosiruptor naganoensis TaxID=29324 RepID=A0ABY7BGA5_9FIRM|nr:extracellular solute-binding protein [Caldicellulosiruptor naganoensis]WAM31855.1 extracellular solute-binding protein [Caldicellulosiruptor naganoensis]